MMTIEEALEYINSKSWSQWKLGLSRTFELLRRVGDPQKDLKFVHIAGTNGKGSTSAMIASILIESGYRTGMYPSPFIERFNERIQINGEQISDEDLRELTEIVKEAGDAMEDHPTHFEIITALGMLYFKRKGCDVVVLEVGLGGTFDSTNVIDPPELCVITNIGFDHTQYLGKTLAEIASAKAGIIKDGCDVVCYPNVPEVIGVIEEAARGHGAEVGIADFGRISRLSADLEGQKLLWRRSSFAHSSDCAEQEKHSFPVSRNDEENDGISQYPDKDHNIVIDLPLAGVYQMRNAAVALTAAEKLAEKGWSITEESVKAGMAKTNWPARFEVLRSDPVFILDGGHNRQCAEAVAESLKEYLPGRKLTFLIGMLGDKDYDAVLDVLLPFASKCCCVTPDSDRALPAERLEEAIRERAPEDIETKTYDSVEDAVSDCLAGEASVLAFGSLYMAGEVRKAYRKAASQTEKGQ